MKIFIHGSVLLANYKVLRAVFLGSGYMTYPNAHDTTAKDGKSSNVFRQKNSPSDISNHFETPKFVRMCKSDHRFLKCFHIQRFPLVIGPKETEFFKGSKIRTTMIQEMCGRGMW